MFNLKSFCHTWLIFSYFDRTKAGAMSERKRAKSYRKRTGKSAQKKAVFWPFLDIYTGKPASHAIRGFQGMGV